MAHTKVALTQSRPNIGRSLLLALAIVGGTALTGADEILVSAPFIALNETLGFWLGFATSIAFWAFLGLVTLIAVDLIWPILKPYWDNIYPTIAKVLTYVGVVAVLVVVIVLAVFSVAIIEFLGNHLVFLGILCGVVAAVFVLLVVYEWLRGRIEWFVEYVPNITRRWVRTVSKLLAGLAVLVYMGPVLSRPFLVPLGVTSRKWAYVLTFVAAPVFAGFWYPFYNLGVWDNIQRVLF